MQMKGRQATASGSRLHGVDSVVFTLGLMFIGDSVIIAAVLFLGVPAPEFAVIAAVVVAAMMGMGKRAAP